jgi:Putative Actinobacterial Holin-X, holin superfamily III
MFALLLNALRADLDRQLDWAKAEAKRQAGHIELTIILIGVASLAGLGAVIVGLIALYVWLAAQTTQFVALGAIGGGLLLLALILFALARIRRRPQFAPPPPVQLVQPAALLGISTKNLNSRGLVGGEQAAAMRNGSRSGLLGTLAIMVLIGVIVGRRAMNRGIDKTRRS